ncbi:MAG: MFS transporter [Clostridiales bacterium]|nr:MFS transporter [Clostridiales bacterium]
MKNRTKIINISLFVLYMVSAIQSSIMSVVQNDIIRDYGLSIAEAGFLSTASSIGMFASLFSIPFVQSRVKRMTCMTIGLVLMVVDMVLIGISTSFYVLLAAIAFMSLGSSYHDTFLNSLVIDLNGKDAPRYMNLLHTFFSVGALINPYIVKWIANISGSWQAVYYIIAFFLVLAYLHFVFQARKGMDVPAMRQAKGATLSKEVVKELVKDKRIVLTALQSTLYSSAQMGIASWIVTYINMEVGTPNPTGFALLDTLAIDVFPLSLLWVGITIGRLIMAKVGWNPVKTLAYGCFISVPVLVIGIISANYWALCAMTVIFGIICGHGIPSLTARAGRNTPGRTAMGTTISSLIGNCVSWIWPLMIAAIADVHGFRFGLLVTAGLLIASGIIGLLNDKACREYDEAHPDAA